ncbi:antA/AntB antirepressor family protein [Providencia rettgeri]|nr:antA/AntB antirepressor family protein [Providencia rettgeri]
MKKKNSPNFGASFAHPENHSSDIKELSFAEMLPIIRSDINGQLINCVSAKALHSALGIKRNFAAWFGDRTNQYEFIENQDYFIVESLSYPKSDSSKSRPQLTKDYHVTINTAKELGIVENNEYGRLIRQYFIKCEETLHKVAPTISREYKEDLKARLKAANYFQPMCNALEAARLRQGKTTQRKHYLNESNMINRLVLGGLTAIQWAEKHGYKGKPRDSMTPMQLEHLAYLERSNITLIEMDMNYPERKARLLTLSYQWLQQRIRGE